MGNVQTCKTWTSALTKWQHQLLFMLILHNTSANYSFCIVLIQATFELCSYLNQKMKYNIFNTNVEEKI